MKLIDLIFRMNYTLLQGSLEQDITEVIYDSRKAVPGCIFLCLPGAVTDGHKYIPDVLEKGAVALVVEQDVKVPEHITVLKVDNSRVALAELAAAWYGHPAEKLTTIGVTGTKGKTTTTYMIRGILEKAGLPTGLIGTIEAIIGEKHIPASNTTPESYTIQKYFAEMVGTMVLVLMGCGSAVFLGCDAPAEILAVAFAFGLSVVAMAYSIGGISGCHINPAITLGVWLSKRMSGKDAAGYMAGQFAGALIGSALGTELAAVISEKTLEALLLIALPCVAVFLTVKKDFGKDIPAEERPVYSVRREVVTAALIGLVFGCYDGLIGPGTGTFMILGFTGFLSLDLITAGGCAKATNLASNVAAAVVWILHGNVLWEIALPAIACSILGSYLGARYAIRGGSKKIRNMMFVVLALLFIKMGYELLF